MKKNLLRHLSVLACITAVAVAVTACGGSTPSNGGIPTQEQLSAAQDALGDKISSLSFSVDGVIYQFPMYVSDMTDNGWAFDSSTKSSLKTIEADTLVAPAVSMRKKATDGYAATSCSVQPINKSASEISLENTRIYKITFSKSNGTTLILPSGITWDSTFEEVKEVCKPEAAFDQDGIKYMKIKGEDSAYSITINFDATQNTITSVEYQGRL